MHWDDATQCYLALLALDNARRDDLRSPGGEPSENDKKIRESIKSLNQELSFPKDLNSPRNYDPKQFRTELGNLLDLLTGKTQLICAPSHAIATEGVSWIRRGGRDRPLAADRRDRCGGRRRRHETKPRVHRPIRLSQPKPALATLYFGTLVCKRCHAESLDREAGTDFNLPLQRIDDLAAAGQAQRCLSSSLGTSRQSHGQAAGQQDERLGAEGLPGLS